MEIIKDESSNDLGALLGTLRSIAPDLWESRERSLVLPREMGDLENPEFLNKIREKIQALKETKEMMDKGSISQEDYSHIKIEILSRV